MLAWFPSKGVRCVSARLMSCFDIFNQIWWLLQMPASREDPHDGVLLVLRTLSRACRV